MYTRVKTFFGEQFVANTRFILFYDRHTVSTIGKTYNIDGSGYMVLVIAATYDSDEYFNSAASVAVGEYDKIKFFDATRHAAACAIDPML